MCTRSRPLQVMVGHPLTQSPHLSPSPHSPEAVAQGRCPNMLSLPAVHMVLRLMHRGWTFEFFTSQSNFLFNSCNKNNHLAYISVALGMWTTLCSQHLCQVRNILISQNANPINLSPTTPKQFLKEHLSEFQKLFPRLPPQTSLQPQENRVTWAGIYGVFIFVTLVPSTVLSTWGVPRASHGTKMIDTGH